LRAKYNRPCIGHFPFSLLSFRGEVSPKKVLPEKNIFGAELRDQLRKDDAT
jgi:hypothetical protein